MVIGHNIVLVSLETLHYRDESTEGSEIHRGSSVWSCVEFIYVRFLSNSRSDRQVGIKYQLQGLCRTKDSGFDWHIEVAGGVAKTAIGLNKLLQALSIMFSFYNGQFYIFSFFIKIYN